MLHVLNWLTRGKDNLTGVLPSSGGIRQIYRPGRLASFSDLLGKQELRCAEQSLMDYVVPYSIPTATPDTMLSHAVPKAPLASSPWYPAVGVGALWGLTVVNLRLTVSSTP